MVPFTNKHLSAFQFSKNWNLPPLEWPKKNLFHVWLQIRNLSWTGPKFRAVVLCTFLIMGPNWLNLPHLNLKIYESWQNNALCIFLLKNYKINKEAPTSSFSKQLFPPSNIARIRECDKYYTIPLINVSLAFRWLGVKFYRLHTWMNRLWGF